MPGTVWQDCLLDDHVKIVHKDDPARFASWLREHTEYWYIPGYRVLVAKTLEFLTIKEYLQQRGVTTT